MMTCTYIVTITAAAEESENRKPLGQPVQELLTRQLQSLYGHHWLLPTGAREPKLVKIERYVITNPGDHR